MEEMEYTELKAKLESLEAEQREIERALAAKRDQRKAEIISQFKEQIAEEGFSLGEMVESLGPRRGPRKSAGNRSYPRYVDNADPNCVYVRGPLPTWMKEKMVSVGLEPSDKDDRERYKKEYMQMQS